MKAVVFHGPYNVKFDNVMVPTIKAHEVLIRVKLCGLCGTDFHIYKCEAAAAAPVILGHEFVGLVADKGAAVTTCNIGDHVAVDPNIHCGDCRYCRLGQINYCEHLQALGVTMNGGFAEYATVPASQLYGLPKELSFTTAAFAEPLSCCIRGIDRADIKMGESVVIIGGGMMGFLILQLAKIAGAGKIGLVELDAKKRAIALELGANHVFDATSSKLYAEIIDTMVIGPDVVIDCVSNSAALSLAVKLPRKGGRVIMCGLATQEDIPVNFRDIFHKELSFKSSLLNPFTFARAVDLLVNNKIQVQKLNPVVVNLTELDKVLKQRDGSVIKYQIAMD